MGGATSQVYERGWKKDGLGLILGALGYWLLAKWGLSLATVNSSASPVFPAAGYAIIFLSVLGRRFWPAIFVGAFAVNVGTSVSLSSVFMIAVGNTISAYLGSWLLEKMRDRQHLFQEQSRTLALASASLVAPLVSASVGTLALGLAGIVTLQTAHATWLTWWIGDVLGIFILAPLLQSLVAQFSEGLPSKGPSAREVLERFVIASLVMGVTFILFTNPRYSGDLFAIFPLILLATSRLRDREVDALVVAISLVCLWATKQGLGPFGNGVLNQNLINMQLFMGTVGLTAQVLAGFKRAGPLRLPAVVLLTGWVISSMIFASFHQTEIDRDRAHLDDMVDDVRVDLENRMNTYLESLRAGTALFAAVQDVSDAAWSRYVTQMNLHERYPGMIGMGFLQSVSAEKLAGFEKHERTLHPGFTVHAIPNLKEEERPRARDHFIVTSLEPAPKTMSILGIDHGSEPRRRTAAELARDTGQPSLASRITLASDPLKRPAFQLYYPIYRTGVLPTSSFERRQNFGGWIYAPIVIENFMSGILGRKSEELNVFLFEGAPGRENLFYASRPEDQDFESFDKLLPIQLSQHEFTLAFREAPGFVSSHDSISAWVAAVGALITLLLATLVMNLQAINARATELARQKTKLLRESEVRLSELMRFAPVGLFITDLQGSLIYANSDYCEISGLTESQMAGKGWMRILHPDDRDRVLAEWTNSVNERRPFAMTYRLLNPDGRLRWVLGRSIVLRESGEATGFMGAVQDFTEQKEAEAALENKNQELDQALKSAEVAARTKTEFLANISHEIRTPINGILGMTHLLADTSLNEEQKNFLNSVELSGVRLLSMVNDVLDFSKIDAGKMALEKIDYDPRQMIAEVVHILEYSASEKKIGLAVEVEASVPAMVVGDPGRVQQILINLVSNGIKFTEKGEVRVKLGMDHFADAREALRFEVSDTGIGIRDKMIPQLFQPFTQADASMNRRFGGTGLGLSICKRLAELMKGEIGLSSRDGLGSVFWLRLPFEPASVQLAATSPMVEKIPLALPTTGKRQILVAEDNRVNQIVTVRMLEKLGYTAQAVNNGKEALDALKITHFDLILMDCQMPELDGFEATAVIRADADLNCQKIPIVALTANALEGDREKCLSCGMDDYMAKPVKLEVLAKTLSSWLTERSA